MSPPGIINPPADPSHLAQVQDRMFGVDLSAVRPQAGQGTAGAQQQLGAQAYAQGSNTPLFFGPGGYNPGMTADMHRLMGHEATHVVQQGGGNR